tara:strand:+ start:530 stop:751 length:222 start_codon:yes stop_codon:yes gene_type:complete
MAGVVPMKCDCYSKAFLPVIELLEEAAGKMYFRTPEFDAHQQRIHDIVLSMNMRFTCIDGCYRQTTLPLGDSE